MYTPQTWVDKSSSSTTPIDAARLGYIEAGIQAAYNQSGLDADKPTPTSTNAGTFWVATDTGIVYLSTGSAWTAVVAPGSSVSSSAPGNAENAGSGIYKYAFSDHVHGREPWGSLSDIASLGPTAAAAGSSGAVADASHVHALEWGSTTQITTISATISPTPGSTGYVADAGHAHGVTFGSSAQISTLGPPATLATSGSTGAVADAGHGHAVPSIPAPVVSALAAHTVSSSGSAAQTASLIVPQAGGYLVTLIISFQATTAPATGTVEIYYLPNGGTATLLWAANASLTTSGYNSHSGTLFQACNSGDGFYLVFTGTSSNSITFAPGGQNAYNSMTLLWQYPNNA